MVSRGQTGNKSGGTVFQTTFQTTHRGSYHDGTLGAVISRSGTHDRPSRFPGSLIRTGLIRAGLTAGLALAFAAGLPMAAGQVLTGQTLTSQAMAQSVDGFSTWSPGDARTGDVQAKPTPRSRWQRDGRRRKKARRHSTIVDKTVKIARDGVYRTIRDAIDHTRPGGTVLVRPGVYPESIELTWPVVLRGDVRAGHTGSKRPPESEMVVMRPPAGKPCFVIDVKSNTDVVDIRDFWFAQEAGKVNTACIIHQEGRLILADSIIRGHEDAAGLMLAGPNAQIDGSVIERTRVGILIAQDRNFASAGSIYTITNNTFQANGIGLHTDSYGADVTVSGNTFGNKKKSDLGNTKAAMMISKGHVRLIDNKVLRSGLDGVVVLTPDSLELRGNDLLANNRFGLYLPMASQGLIADNLIACNGKSGIAVGARGVEPEEAYPGNVVDQNPPKRSFFGRVRHGISRKPRNERETLGYGDDHLCKDFLE